MYSRIMRSISAESGITQNPFQTLLNGQWKRKWPSCESLLAFKSARNIQRRLVKKGFTVIAFLCVDKYFTHTYSHSVIRRYDYHTLPPMVFVFAHIHSHSGIRRHNYHTLPPMVFVFAHTHSHSVIRRHDYHTLPPMVFVFAHRYSHSVIRRHDYHTLLPMVFVFAHTHSHSVIRRYDYIHTHTQ